jgi:hypothetical protein
MMKKQIGKVCWVEGCIEQWPCNDHPVCPNCGGPMLDHREADRDGKGEPKRTKKAPDYDCVSEACLKKHKKAKQRSVYWPNEWQNAGQHRWDAAAVKGLVPKDPAAEAMPF